METKKKEEKKDAALSINHLKYHTNMCEMPRAQILEHGHTKLKLVLHG